MKLGRYKVVIGSSIVTIAVAVCCCAGLYGRIQLSFSHLGDTPGNNNACDPKYPTNIEDLAQLKFPPSVRNLRSSCFGMQGWLGYAQFEMAPSDLDYFVSHLQIRSPLARDGIPADDELATKASTLRSFLHGNYQIYNYNKGKSFFQDVLIDTSNPSQYFVYVNFGGG
jgi:hypothetical protein